MKQKRRQGEEEKRRENSQRRRRGRLRLARLLVSSASLLLFWNARADVAPQNSALLAFKREQIALAEKMQAQNAGFAWPELKAWIQDARVRAAQIEAAPGDAATVPPIEAPFRLEERAYFAANDGSAQPFWVALPSDYSPDKKWPLVVFLHGYSPAISKLSPSLLDGDTLADATRLGFVVAIPYGRRNSDFVQWGEDDVMRVKRECAALYSIDASRTFLEGASMGGYGAYAVALHTPGEWTAVAPIAGRTDFYRWFGLARAETPVWKTVLYDSDDPHTLVENGRATPFLSQHGALDKTVPVEHSRLWMADAKRLHLPYTYQEVPEIGHENAFQLPAIKGAFAWLARQSPRPVPRQISFSSGDLREAKSDWAQIEAFSDYSQTARLDAGINGEAVEVKTKNLARFSLDLKALALGTVALNVDGTKTGDFDSSQPLTWSAPNAKTGKSPSRCGPFKSLLRDPFTLVYGDERDRKDALHFAREWSECADGTAPVKAAKDVSDADKTNRNLILFGSRDSNPLLREIGDALPVELTKSGFRLGQKNFEGKNFGLRMVRPSPWNAARLVGVCCGAWWGTTLPVNHKWDLLPDYIIYDGTQTERFGAQSAHGGVATEHYETNRAIRAGFFDGNWNLPDAG
jgi:poly(3-hydroxybutyrate) depolymerase